MPRRYIAVCGASEATTAQLDAAREVGKLLAEAGAVRLGRSVVALDSWSVKGLESVDTAADVVRRALG